MKKLLLASAVAALSVSAANAAPTVYGKAFVTADYVDVDAGSYDEDEFQINSNSSRIGFKGSEPITANTDVVYRLEYGIDVDGDKDDTFTRRDTYLGLANKSFGEIRVGHNQSTTDYINNVTPAASGGFWDNLGDDENMVDSGRVSNTIIWKAPKYNDMPVEFAAMYKTEEEGEDGYGLSLMFDQGSGFTAGIAYDKDVNVESEYEKTPASGNNDAEYVVGGGEILRGTLSFDFDKFNNSGMPLTIGGLYQRAEFDGKDEKEKGYILSAEYGLQNFTKPASVYVQYNNTSDVQGEKDHDSDQIVVGGKYYYQKNMIAHLYAGQNTYEQPGEDDRDLLAIGGGLEYKF